jgi:phosphopantothenoylcysteine synthetase/decarboxylase
MIVDRPRVLVTAGNTREKIDSVRWWSNIFTGQTGLDIAQAISAIADVTLLTSNAEHLRQVQSGDFGSGITADYFESHADLIKLIETHLAKYPFDAVYMTAAISDYTPAGAYHIIFREPAAEPDREVWVVDKIQRPKISSTHDAVAIAGIPTLKIIDQFRKVWKYRGLLFKFKLEVGLDQPALIAVAQASRAQSKADVIVANTLDMVRGPDASALIIDKKTVRRVPRNELAQALRDELISRLKLRPPDTATPNAR